MKPSFLTLFIAAGAFGASTIYLALQLKEERDRADQVQEQTRALTARISELERAQAELDQLRLAGGGSFTDGGMAQAGKLEDPPKPVPVPAGETEPTADGAGNRVMPAGPMGAPERSEAFQKMVRSQIRANNKRLYADVASKLGLTKEQANELIDLLTEQQMAGMERARQERIGGPNGESRAASYEMERQKNLAEVTALIGADKAELYKEYQESLPARQEVEMLSRQLEGGDLGLSKDQHDRMVTALAEERKRNPAPKYADSGSREEYIAAMTAWQEDYSERTAARAKNILSSEQYSTFNEYQAWQKEMRTQMESRRATRGGGDAMMGPPISIAVPAAGERPPR